MGGWSIASGCLLILGPRCYCFSSKATPASPLATLQGNIPCWPDLHRAMVAISYRTLRIGTAESTHQLSKVVINCRSALASGIVALLPL